LGFLGGPGPRFLSQRKPRVSSLGGAPRGPVPGGRGLWFALCLGPGGKPGVPKGPGAGKLGISQILGRNERLGREFPGQGGQGGRGGFNLGSTFNFLGAPWGRKGGPGGPKGPKGGWGARGAPFINRKGDISLGENSPSLGPPLTGRNGQGGKGKTPGPFNFGGPPFAPILGPPYKKRRPGDKRAVWNPGVRENTGGVCWGAPGFLGPGGFITPPGGASYFTPERGSPKRETRVFPPLGGS